MRSAFVVVVFCAGCFDGAVNDGAVLVCGGQGDCPDGFRCVDAAANGSGRCVVLDGGDTTPPAIVSSSAPDVLSRIDEGVVEFVVDEDLAVVPAVFANGDGVVVVDDGDRAFHVDVNGADLDEGFVFFDAVLVDVAGNTARVSLPGVRVDKTGPAIVNVDVDARVRGPTVIVVVVASEELREASLRGDEVVDGNVATFRFEVRPPPGDGFPQPLDIAVELGALSLTDLAGNISFFDLDRTVVVDAVPPTVDITVQRPRVSLVDGFRDIVVDIDVDAGAGDSVSSVVVELDDVPMPCGFNDDGSRLCLLDVSTTTLAAGPHNLTAAAFDTVGNAGFDGAAIEIDVSGPTVTSSSVSTRARTGVALPNRVAGLGSTVLASAVLADDGAITSQALFLIDNAGVEHAIVEGFFVIDDNVAEGDADVVVRSVDDVGNAAEATLATIAVSGLVPSPCNAVDVDGVPVCTDFDGDRTFGVSEACPFLETVSQDCDDSDPAVTPNGFERPGDGIDNDCAGDGDASVDDDSRYVFVTVDGRANSRGSRNDPMPLDVGMARAAALGKDVVVAAGTYDFADLVAESVIFGGYDPVTWEVDAGPTVFLHPMLFDEGQQGRASGLVDITFSAADWSILITDRNTAAGITWLVRVVVTDVECPNFCGLMVRSQRPLRVIDMDAALVGATNVGIEANAGGLLIGSRITGGPSVAVVNGASLDVVRSHIVGGGNAVISEGENLNIIDSVLDVDGASGDVVELRTGGGHVFHSTLRGLRDADSFVTGATIDGSGTLVVVNSVIDVVIEAFGGGGGVIEARGNAIAADCPIGGPGVCEGIAVLNGSPGCGGNVGINRGDVDEDGGLLVDRAGVDVSDAAEDFSVVAGDSDSVCRDVAAPDIGP